MFKCTPLRAAFALAFVSLLAGCGSDQAPSDAPSKAPEPIVVVPTGKVVSVGGFEVGLASMKKRKQIGTEGIGPAAGAGETFVVARYTVRNVGAQPVDSTDFPKFELIDGNGQVFVEDDQATMLASALNDAHTGALNPSVTAQLVSVWKVSTSSFDPAKWHLKVSFDQGLSAKAQKVARWPLEVKFPAPVLLTLK